MSFREYLPSVQFQTLTGAVAVSGILIYGSILLTAPQKPEVTGLQSTTPTSSADDTWQAAFASSTLFAQDQSISQQAKALVNASQSANLTESIGRSLVVNTTAAQAQGLGSDQPTQDQIVSAALSQMQTAAISTTPYTSADFTLTDNGPAALHAYGNALAQAIAAHPQATYNSTMVAVGLAIDENNSATLSRLPAIAKEYKTLAKALVQTPVPPSLQGLALQIVNNYLQIAATFSNMASVLSDPVRGLAGLQQYNALNTQNAQVFTQLASVFQNASILFVKGDAGAEWSLFLSAAQRAATQAQTAAAQQTQTNTAGSSN